MALYGYYKSGYGLFIDNGGTWENSSDATLTASEAFLLNLSFEKLTAYKIKIDTWEYVTNDKFAQVPGKNLFKFVGNSQTKYIASEYLTDATYFTEIQYDPNFI